MASRKPVVMLSTGFGELPAGDDLSGPALGAATAVTKPATDNSTAVATTAQVQAAVKAATAFAFCAGIAF